MSAIYEDLKVWQLGMSLAERVYTVTASFPSDERFGLTAQLRRASVSIPSNIAEGRGRGRDTELIRFLGIAYGSLMEVETQLKLSARLRFLGDSAADEILELCSELARMLNGLMSSLRNAGSTTDSKPRADRRLPTAD